MGRANTENTEVGEGTENGQSYWLFSVSSPRSVSSVWARPSLEDGRQSYRGASSVTAGCIDFHIVAATICAPTALGWIPSP